MTEIYRIAEKNIRIVSRHKSVHDLCRDYRFDGDFDTLDAVRLIWTPPAGDRITLDLVPTA